MEVRIIFSLLSANVQISTKINEVCKVGKLNLEIELVDGFFECNVEKGSKIKVYNFNFEIKD